ncbi:MAG: DUF3501 family protein, partial [Actinobacteria bacterium]|nr:DUF3501 family protein [Actinomycetota bacterium]
MTSKRKLSLDDILDHRAYERVREERRNEVIEVKRRRRLHLGTVVTVAFENRKTMLNQIQEMLRVERTVTDEGVMEELRAYNPMIPEPGQLCATLFIELEEDVGAAARVVVSDGVARRQTLLRRSRLGRRTLKRTWMELIGESMVLAQRFDPLHDRESEARLANLVWNSARRASQEGSVVVTLPTPRGDCSVTLTRDQFTARAAPIYRELSGMLHELRPAAARVDLLVAEHDLSLPGFIEMLADFRSCRVLSL